MKIDFIDILFYSFKILLIAGVFCAIFEQFYIVDINVFLYFLVISTIYFTIRSFIIKRTKMIVVNVYGKETHKIKDSFGKRYLYPKNTKRVISKFVWLPTKKYRYNWLKRVDIKQECIVDIASDGNDVIYYNKWSNCEFDTIEKRKYKLEKLNKI